MPRRLFVPIARRSLHAPSSLHPLCHPAACTCALHSERSLCRPKSNRQPCPPSVLASPSRLFVSCSLHDALAGTGASCCSQSSCNDSAWINPPAREPIQTPAKQPLSVRGTVTDSIHVVEHPSDTPSNIQSKRVQKSPHFRKSAKKKTKGHYWPLIISCTSLYPRSSRIPADA